MADYTISTRAQADLENILSYTFEAFGDRQAVRYEAQLFASMELAARFEFVSRAVTTSSGRKLRAISSGRHVIFFQGAGDDLLVVRILHQAMDFDRHL